MVISGYNKLCNYHFMSKIKTNQLQFDGSDGDKSKLIEKIGKLESKLHQTETKLGTAENELNRIRKEHEDLVLLRADKTFGVAVCGDVMMNKLEVRIINSGPFQRLRKVKQLGSTFLVYPSAIHTRFEHSLGVLKAADLIIKSIKHNKHSSDSEKMINSEEEQIIRLLALLHDIGHMPYGHTIEDEFGIFRSHDKHETRWDYFVGKDSPIGEIIIEERGLDFHDRFYRLIKCEKDFSGFEGDAYMYDIVSNTVCADLLDYLDRDCFYTNLRLKYHPRFLNYFFIKTAIREVGTTASHKQISERRIAIRVHKYGKKELRRDIVSDLIQLLRNRYYLGERVYYHHTKIMTGTLIAGAVARAKFANCFDELDIDNDEFKKRTAQNSDLNEDKRLFKVHVMGDEDLLAFLKKLATKSKSEEQIKKIKGAMALAKAFDDRLKYKEIVYRTKDQLGIEDEFDTDIINQAKGGRPKHDIAEKLHNRFIKYGSSSERLAVEDNICDYLEMNSGDLLIYCPNFNMAMKQAKVLVEDDKMAVHRLMDYNDKNIKSECKSIIEKHQALWALRVFIHPKYVDNTHPEYSEKYEDYLDIILKYCDWTILAVDNEDENKKAEIFWNAYIEYVLRKHEASGSGLAISLGEKRQKISKLTRDFMSSSFGDRDYKTIASAIGEKFGI
jgi:HD superfamily phosphohydrolase